jgi:hypothetical protein
VGDLKSVYDDQNRNGIHKGFLIFDPYLVAEVPDDHLPRGLPDCDLKFRLVGIRSFGESPEGAFYFPNLDLL